MAEQDLRFLTNIDKEIGEREFSSRGRARTGV